MNSIVDEIAEVTAIIRNAFSVESDLDVSEVKEVHQRFISCIEAVNTRLRHCDDLLRKGLRDEAIQECEARPNLLELVDALDFEELAAWRTCTHELGAPQQPEVLVDVAIALNEAYVARQPLEGLMKQHRKLAIARSPLPQRLNVLRQIMQKDPGNPAWRSDVQSYEKAFLNQLATQLKSKEVMQDLAAVTAIYRELNSNEWINKPSITLVDSCKRMYVGLKQVSATQELRRLVPLLNKAFAEFDLENGRLLKGRWDQLFQSGQLDSPPSFESEVASVFQWLEQEEFSEQRQSAYERALKNLESTIEDHENGRIELERAFRVVEDFDEPIPERLIRRFNDRINSFRLQESRKRTLVVGSVVIVLLLVVGGAGWFTKAQLYRNRLNSNIDTISGLLDQNKIEQAGDFLDKLQLADATVYAEPAVQALRMKQEELSREESERKKLFESALSNSRRIIEEKPDWDGLQLAQEDFENAKKQTNQSLTEEAELKELERDLRLLETSLQAKVNDETNEILDRLSRQLVEIQRLSTTDIANVKRELLALTSNRRITPESRRQAEILKKKIDDEQSRVEMRQKETTASKLIQDSVGNPTRFKAAIADYLKLVDKGATANELRQNLSEMDRFFTAIEEWNSFAQQWNLASLKGEVPDSGNLAKLITDIQERFKGVPGLLDVRKCLTFLIDCSVRNKNPALYENIESLLDNPSLSDFLVVEESNGTISYVVLEPQVTSTKVVFYPIETINIKDAPKAKRVDIESVVQKPGGRYFTDSNQRNWTKTAKNFLPGADPSNKDWSYEKRASSLLGTLQSAEIDPLLKISTLETLFTECMKHSSIVREAFREAYDDFAILRRRVENVEPEQQVEDFDWLSDDESNRRLLAAQLLEAWDAKHDLLEIAKQEIVAPLEQMIEEKPKLENLRWAGSLFRSRDGWHFESIPNRANGEIYVLMDEGNGAFRLQAIEAEEDGDVVTSSGVKLTEGQLVFSFSR